MTNVKEDLRYVFNRKLVDELEGADVESLWLRRYNPIDTVRGLARHAITTALKRSVADVN